MNRKLSTQIDGREIPIPVGARTCPNAGESYEVQELMDPLPRRRDVHPVETEQDVIIDDGEVALRIKAICECGWSDTEVING